MLIKIPLPGGNGVNTYKELHSYLKQMELAVHHAQKAVEHAEKDGIEISEDCYACFRHPAIDDLELNDEDAKFKGENFYEELQSVELEINLQ
jgi:hypothetical protein